MSLKLISPHAARELMNQGAILVDIRAAGEHARERIAQARHVPMDRLQSAGFPIDAAPAVIFHCRSGNRTQGNASALAACTGCDAYVLEGGLDAWKKAGLPVVADASQPLELQRQVQIVAGSLIVLGAALGSMASPWFHVLSGFVGAGLVFTGVSGFCGLARLLMRMPWNRRMLGG
ncbi:rhodanese family protein [Pseudorhodoferax soli]|uniref:Rhodanese-related sulfurtransferase n=1 Tax=Pseudorhodoferax soli TaxID=545864 RepID=A0A368XN81_9BURK|nr:rhodanese family protein [Pseudorhodoferax soli]RCW67957.1 rhodanese-related sulfurtransferase [Pseudorhodoferax soli]